MTQNRHIIYISHGGGPLPLLGDPDHSEMATTLKLITDKVGKPSAILVISAHWEARIPTITSGATPQLIYDYGGFPKEAYEIQYPTPGQPELAKRIHESLTAAGIESKLNEQRGFDHGLFVPLKIMYPDADIPCVQLSLVHGLDPQAHLALGHALKTLEWENLLVIGSGFSFHNMRAFFSSNTYDNDQKNQAFQDWLLETITNSSIDHEERTRRLTQWEQVPHARFCHPREEHLLPLHVCYGMAEKISDEYFSAIILKKHSLMFHWRQH